MKDLTNLKYNGLGGIDGIYNGKPYTLNSSEYDLVVNGELGTISKVSQSTLDIIEKIELLSKITLLENSISARRYREASLGDNTAIDFIQDIDDQIKVLRV